MFSILPCLCQPGSVQRTNARMSYAHLRVSIAYSRQGTSVDEIGLRSRSRVLLPDCVLWLEIWCKIRKNKFQMCVPPIPPLSPVAFSPGQHTLTLKPSPLSSTAFVAMIMFKAAFEALYSGESRPLDDFGVSIAVLGGFLSRETCLKSR